MLFAVLLPKVAEWAQRM